MEDVEFRLYQAGIELIQKCILNDPTALRNWPDYIYSFVSSASPRQRLRDVFRNGEHAEAIMKTLEGWLEEQGNNSTFGELIELLRRHDLNDLCDNLIKIKEDIKDAQCTNKFAIERGRRRNCWFGMSDPIANFVGRVEDLKTLHNLLTENRDEVHSSVALLTSLHGFGGIGKTTVAREYAWRYMSYFDGNVIWINSETFGSMRRAFEMVAEKLNLPRKVKLVFDLETLVKPVYEAFSGSKSLFIFDNTEHFDGHNGIQQFLPTGITRKPYLLLTSRRKDCFLTNRVLQLDVMNRTDSVHLIQKYIPGASRHICVKLSDRLERVPLAIQQAIAYIKESLPGFCTSSEKDVAEAVNLFLEEYDQNSKKILKYNFVGVDGYAKNIYSICKMSLRRMKSQKNGKFTKYILRYISFLNPDNIQLDFILKLEYDFDSTWNKFQKVIKCNSSCSDLNEAVDLLCSYSLITVNISGPKKIIKVHRVVQDALRFMSPQNEELYVKRLITCYRFQGYDEKFLHLLSIHRSCRSKTLKHDVQKLIPKSFELLETAFSTSLSIQNLSELVVTIKDPDKLRSTIPTLSAMNCCDINQSVGIYLKIHNMIRFKVSTDLALTNYIILEKFIVPEADQHVFRNIFECITLLHMKQFKITFLQDLLGHSFGSEDVPRVLDLLSSTDILIISSDKLIVMLHADYYILFDDRFFKFKISKSFFDEFPCLKYLKSSSSLDKGYEKHANNFSWDYTNSIIWPLFQDLEFNLEAIRSAIAYVCYSDTSISDYLCKYKLAAKNDPDYNRTEIIVKLVTASYLQDQYANHNTVLSLICCLMPEFHREKVEYICKLDVEPRILSDLSLFELEKWRILKQTSNGVYVVDKHLQYAIRCSVLSAKNKSKAVEAIHKACFASEVDRRFRDELLNDWRNILSQKDLKQIAVNANLCLIRE